MLGSLDDLVALNDFVYKAVQDRKYIQKVDDANVFRKRMMRKANTKKFKANFAQDLAAIKNFANIDIYKIEPEDLKEYNRLTKKLLTGKVETDAINNFIDKYPQRVPHRAPEIQKKMDMTMVENLANDIRQDIRDIKTLDDYRREHRRLSIMISKAEKLYKNGDIDEDVFNQIQAIAADMLGVTTDEVNKKILRRIPGGELKEAQDRIKENMYNDAQANMIGINPDNLIEGIKEAFNDIKSITLQQVKDMPLGMAIRYDNAIYNLSQNVETADINNVKNYIVR